MDRIGASAAKLIKQKSYVGGKWLSALNGKTYPVNNPATNEVICNVPDMSEKETHMAIDSASKAFEKWQKTTAKERSGLLRKWFNLCEEHKEDLAKIITLEAGKPLNESRGEMTYGSSYIEWFSEEARRIDGDILQSPSPTKHMMFIRQPIGVCGIITPWNFPNAMITRKVAAALAAGCTCVMKPAEDTPLSALALVSLAEEAGLPEGVINVVTSSRGNAASIGNTICESQEVAGISFTGSTKVGKLLYKLSSSTVKHLDLELGGNAPFIVFDSAKISTAINSLMVAKFRNSGQTCISANRIFVHASIFDEFVSTLKETLEKQLLVGDGLDDGVNIGPLINTNQLEKVESIVRDAESKGASLILGGERHSLGGTYFQPTILTGCDSQMRCFAEEIFGPVIPIKKFENEADVVKDANSVRDGLASYIFSQDTSQILRVSQNLEYGMVGVNEGLISTAEAAFGGVKESGLGREGSKYGLDGYLDTKYICIGDLQR